MKIKKLISGLLLFIFSLLATSCASQDNPYKQLYCLHNFKEIYIPATCTEDGIKMEKCTKCGYERNKKEFGATGHAFSVTNAEESTCLIHGHSTLVCLKCGYQYTEELPLLEHKYATIDIIPPTCSTDGYTLEECSYCHATIKTNIVPATGHQLNTITVQPTCTTNGYTYEKCATCGLEIDHHDIVSSLGHDYGEVLIHQLSCTEDGYSYRVCKRCHQESEHYDVIKAPGHDLHTIVVPATCCEDGYSYDVCSRCDYVSEHYAIEETQGHVFRIIQKEPTCTQEGYLIKECVNCDEVEYTKYPVLGHDYIEKIVPPTCTEDGYSHHVCKLCGKEDEEVGRYHIQSATGHLPTVKQGKEATCFEEGYTAETSCAICGAILEPSRVLSKTEHNFEVVETVTSTCTINGYTLLECSVCHEQFRIDKGTTNKHKDLDVDKLCDDCGAHLIYDENDFWNIENDMSGVYVLMNDITLSRTTPLGLIEGHEMETDINSEYAIPFTGYLSSNIDNRTISYSIAGTDMGSLIVAPIYCNKGLIEGVNCTIMDVDINHEEANINTSVASISKTKYLAGLTLINQGAIQQCGCVDNFNLSLNFDMSSTSYFNGARREYVNYYAGGLAYLNDEEGIIVGCFNTASLSLNETVAITHNGTADEYIKYDENKIISLIVNPKIGSISYTNNGAITDSRGSLKMNLSINAVLNIIPETYNILNGKIKNGIGNITFGNSINVEQVSISNNGQISNCSGEVINTAAWVINIAREGNYKNNYSRIRCGVGANAQWFKFYGQDDAPIIHTIDLDDEIPEEEGGEGDGN